MHLQVYLLYLQKCVENKCIVPAKSAKAAEMPWKLQAARKGRKI